MCFNCTTCVFTAQHVCSLHNMCVHCTTCVFTAQHVCSLHMCVHCTCVFTAQHVCSLHNMCVHCTCVFAVQHVCSLHNMCVHCTTYVFTAQHVCSLHNMCAHCATCVFTAQHVCSLHNMCAHCTTWVFTAQHVCSLHNRDLIMSRLGSWQESATAAASASTAAAAAAASDPAVDGSLAMSAKTISDSLCAMESAGNFLQLPSGLCVCARACACVCMFVYMRMYVRVCKTRRSRTEVMSHEYESRFQQGMTLTCRVLAYYRHSIGPNTLALSALRLALLLHTIQTIWVCNHPFFCGLFCGQFKF